MSIVARATWGMPGPLGPAMSLPAQVLYLHHSVTTAANGYTAVRQVAQIGVNRFGRASYSYACTPDGVLYEMQGTHIGAHTAGQNSTSLAVVLVGNYETTQISNAQVNAVAWLYRHLISTRRLRDGAPLRGHRDAPGASTACPGRTAYNALPTIRARTTGSQPLPQGDELDMAGKSEFQTWMREVLNEGTARGQRNWAGTSKSTLGGIQTNANRLNALAAKVGAIDTTDEAEVARLVLAELDPEAIAQGIPDDIAAQVADELAARLGT